MKRKQIIIEDISDNDLEYDLFFPSSDSDSNSNIGSGTKQISDSEEELLSDIEWEEVPLETTKKNSELPVFNLQITIDKKDEQNTSKKNSSILLEKRKLFMEYKKLTFNINIILIPFFLHTLVQRAKWTKDARLNRRLKKSIPKLIQQKFFNFKCKKIRTRKEENLLSTLLLGLVHWFRTHYKINSNGFRQHPNRLRYLYSKKSGSHYDYVLNNPTHFYGARPTISLIDPLEDVRQMAKKKMSNRDILLLFYVIILQNLLDTDDYEISICFAIPLIYYDSASKNSDQKMLFEVPNLFDSDLLYPYFWIELNNYGKLIVVDPIVFSNDQEIVKITNPDVPLKYFGNKSITNQKFLFVCRINLKTFQVNDISPRYIKNLAYRYFEYIPYCNKLPSSSHYKLYQWYLKCLQRINQSNTSSRMVINNEKLCSILAYKNVEYPKTFKELKKSDNFTVPYNLKTNEIINPCAKPIGIYKISKIEVPLFWKNDILELKSRQHWSILGRTVKPESVALKTKKYIPMRNKRHMKCRNEYEIRELYSIDQTIQTPKISEYKVNKYGELERITNISDFKNKFGHIEIYLDYMKPNGFSILYLNDYNIKVRNLLKKYNKHQNHEKKIEYVDVVSGFNFKEQPGYAIPVINSILLNNYDYSRAIKLINKEIEIESLNSWNLLLKKLQIRDRLIDTYDKTQEI